MKRVTITDIARHLRLSPSTVSRALSGDKNIRQETKDIIFKAADSLGYRRNRLAVSLRSGKTNIVGVVVNQMVASSTLHILAGAEKTLHAEGINMMVANSEGDAERERSNIRMMEDINVDGLIIEACAHEMNVTEYLKLKNIGVPMVFVHSVPTGVIVSSVGYKEGGEAEPYLLGEKAAELLLDIMNNRIQFPERILI
ncbi:MAG: LacI family transcriptional regulator [Muribaculaceae bacterium]|nr:LacI family transcriptional regulator [Muribaculaceae bacterium]MDE6533164.1 LacI family transcriptional regulator [Muribaculaceae bacterium]